MPKLRPPIRRLKGGPLAQGLEGCWFLAGYGQGSDLTRKTTLTYSAGFSWQASPIGRGARATAASDRVDTTALPALAEWTWLFYGFCETTGGGAFGRFVAALNDSEFALTFNASGTSLALYLNSGTAQTITVPSLLDKPVLVVIRTVPGSATAVNVWVNGIQYGPYTYTANAIESGAWRLGNRFTSLNRAWGGHIHLQAVWSRSLPLAQVSEIMADPYAMCERVEPWWMQAAGGGPVELAVVFEAAADASFALATPRVLAAAAEAEADVAAALTTPRALAATAEALADLTAGLSAPRAFAVSAEATPDLAAALTAPRALAASAEATPDLDAALATPRLLAVSAEATPDLAVGIRVPRRLAVMLETTADLTVSLITQLGIQLRVTFEALADLTARLTTPRALSVTAEATPDLTARVTVPRRLRVLFEVVVDLIARLRDLLRPGPCRWTGSTEPVCRFAGWTEPAVAFAGSTESVCSWHGWSEPLGAAA